MAEAARVEPFREREWEPRPEPLFVTGIWRSGTSLFYTLLNQHQRISLLYEGDLALLWPLFLVPGGKSRWMERWNFWNQAVERHSIDAEELPGDAANVRTAVTAAYRAYARKKGADIWGCKSPTYYTHLTQLADLFPEARFLVIWRNPVEVASSIVRAAETAPWFRGSGLLLRAMLGARVLKKQCDQLVKRGARIHQLQYERLTENPEAEMRAICEFLEIAYDPRMTSLKGADTSAIYAGGHHEKVKGRKIAPEESKAEAIDPAWKAKIERYCALWLKQTGGKWPEFPPPGSSNTKPASLGERLADWLSFQKYRAIDFAKVVVYSFAPIGMLAKYRARKAENDKEPEGA
jgi:hypothetical protein